MATGGEIIPRLYTRTGDRGTTGLAGGARVEKDSLRIRAYGSYDELGSLLGWVAATLPESLTDHRAVVRRLQHELFVAQAELAAPPSGAGPAHRISPAHVQRVEQDTDRFTATFPPLRSFVLPGGSPAAGSLQFARAVARRAERELVALHRTEPQPEALLAWANRLSALLFAMALSANRALGVDETPPDYAV